MEPRAQVAGVDDRLVARASRRRRRRRPARPRASPARQPSSRASARARSGARVVADAGPVAGGGQAARRPRAVQPAADDPDGRRAWRASACAATAATAPVRSAVTERASSSISGSPVSRRTGRPRPSPSAGRAPGCRGTSDPLEQRQAVAARGHRAEVAVRRGCRGRPSAASPTRRAWWRGSASRARAIASPRRDGVQHGVVGEDGHARASARATIASQRAQPPSRSCDRRPGASPEEAAAVVAALERFMRETAPPPPPGAADATHGCAPRCSRAGREPDGPSPWGDPVPWAAARPPRAPTRQPPVAVDSATRAATSC